MDWMRMTAGSPQGNARLRKLEALPLDLRATLLFFGRQAIWPNLWPCCQRGSRHIVVTVGPWGTEKVWYGANPYRS
jgi:hypothetical protein